MFYWKVEQSMATTNIEEDKLGEHKPHKYFYEQ